LARVIRTDQPGIATKRPTIRTIRFGPRRHWTRGARAIRLNLLIPVLLLDFMRHVRPEGRASKVPKRLINLISILEVRAS
jgi:hypothetical protein